jgi:hypothetical protein
MSARSSRGLAAPEHAPGLTEQLSQDQQITEVTKPRRLATRFRSPQLDLWRLSEPSGYARCADQTRIRGGTEARSSCWQDNSRSLHERD